MTPYEEKCLQSSIKTLETIVNESKEKRDNLEKNLIEDARRTHEFKSNPHYSEALVNSIRVESSVINYMEKQIVELRVKLEGLKSVKN